MLEKNKEISSVAINTLDKNILVSASAGAGKTKLLIDRLIKRITKDHVDVTRILALTFTEAAAFEMKHRLQQAITEQLEKDNSAFLKRQLSLIETASISTIHSFCLSIVKDFSYVLNLNPKMVTNLLDEATKTTMLQHCLDEVIEQATMNNNESFSLLVDHLCHKAHDLEPLKTAIKEVMNVRSSKVDPYLWDEEIIRLSDKRSKITDLPSNIVNLISESELLIIHQLLNVVAKIHKDYTFILEDSIHAWDKVNQLLNNCETFINNRDFASYQQSFLCIATIKTPTIKDDDAYAKLRDSFNKMLKKKVENIHSEETYMNDLHQQQPLFKQLLLLADQTQQLFQQVKVKHQTMDFDDMEKYALEILNHAQFNVSSVYQDRFVDVLVDEFQDTNDIQHEIISKVSRTNNVFRVGDIKQSIYRFRNAKPQLMRDLIQHENDNNINLVLPNNFRSSQDIVQFNNFAFNAFMNIPTFEDRYTQEDHVSIGLERQLSRNIPVELDIIDIDIEQEEQHEDSENNEHASSNVEFDETTQEGQLKARHIAKRITQLLQEGYAFKDICVLVKTHKTKAFLKDVFDEVSIPYFIDTKSGFFNSQPIQDVLTFLRVLENPDDNIAFVGLLASPFFNYSFDELANLAIINRTKHLTYYELIKQEHPEVAVLLHQLKKDSKGKNLTSILSMIYDVNNFYHLSCDEQAKINCDYLLEKAATLDKQHKHSITYFLSIINNLQDEVSSEALAIGKDEDVVKVMTIHQSKGLQFPVVFFWTNNSNKINDLTSKIIVDNDLGIGLFSILLPHRYRRTNILRQAIEFNSVKAELQEQIRLLYVGLTRAETKMICVALKSTESSTDPIDQYMIYKKKGNGYWLSSLFKQSNESFLKMNVVSPTLSVTEIKSLKPLIKDSPILLEKKHKKEDKKLIAFKPSLQFYNTLKQSERGSLIHDALSQLITHSFDISVLEHLDLDTMMKQQILSWVNDPLTKALKEHPMFSEYPIIFTINKQYQQGYIDLLIMTPLKNIIIDFKSDKVTSSEALITRHSDQLKNYVFAIQHIFKDKEVEAFIYSTELQTYIAI